jgi:hypothetical protein
MAESVWPELTKVMPDARLTIVARVRRQPFWRSPRETRA